MPMIYNWCVAITLYFFFAVSTAMQSYEKILFFQRFETLPEAVFRCATVAGVFLLPLFIATANKSKSWTLVAWLCAVSFVIAPYLTDTLWLLLPVVLWCAALVLAFVYPKTPTDTPSQG